MTKIPTVRVDPNTVTGKNTFGKITASTFIRIEFRGGPIDLQGTVLEGNDYQVFCLQTTDFGSGCCVIS